MSLSWLLQNFNEAGFAPNIFEGSDREVGNAFVPETNGRVTALRWYRASTTPAQKPTILRVWDTTTGTALYTAGSIPDSAGVGWKSMVVTEVPAVVARRKYVVSMAWQTNRQHPLYGLGDMAPPNFPLHGWRPIAYQTAGGSIGLPTQAQTGSLYGVDVQVRSQQPPLSWTSQGSTAFDTDIKYEVPANRYRLLLTSYPQWATANVVQGVDVRRIIGGWWPIVGGNVGERRPIDAIDFNMVLPGLTMMDGVLVQCYPGTIGSLEAFTVDA